MFGNAKAERLALELTYEDEADILRPKDVTGSDGITREERDTAAAGIICGISKGGDRSEQTRAQQNIDYDRILFVPPETDIRPRDSVRVRRFGQAAQETEYLVVGRPVPYATHTEVYLKAGDLG